MHNDTLKNEFDKLSYKDYTPYEFKTKVEDICRKYKFNQTTLKSPSKVFGCRILTGYRGKFDSAYIDTLDKIELSAINSEGTILTPFMFLYDGKAIRTNETNKYKIKRKNGKVIVTIEPWKLAKALSLYLHSLEEES